MRKARNNFNFIKKELNNVPLSDSITTIEEYREFLIKYQKQTRDYISDSPLNAIEYQLFMMEDYILPPQLDFRITGNDPFMMYFFQFRASLDKTDISNIWQTSTQSRIYLQQKVDTHALIGAFKVGSQA